MVTDPDRLKKYPRLDLKMDTHLAKLVLDSVASLNYISVADYKKMSPPPHLHKAAVRVYTWMSKEPLPCLGQFQTNLTYKDRTIPARIHVIDGPEADCLLSLPTAERLRIVEILYKVDDEPDIVHKFPKLFTGLGTMAHCQVRLHINERVTPIAQHHRKIPFHLQQSVEEELQDLLQADIIERTSGPTPWVSPVVVVPKKGSPGKVRLCVDMRVPNTAIERERHPGPHISDMIASLNGVQIFSKLDLNKGYHQLELHEESRYITTFSTHQGRSDTKVSALGSLLPLIFFTRPSER